MKFNKCVRCGAFFSSEDNVCPNCKSKDQVDMSTVKNYISQNDMPKSVESLSNRFLEMKEFSAIKNSFKKASSANKKNIQL